MSKKVSIAIYIVMVLVLAIIIIFFLNRCKNTKKNIPTTRLTTISSVKTVSVVTESTIPTTSNEIILDKTTKTTKVKITEVFPE